ncbi:hypothetical protein PFISCL1PPCAC_9131, partial [Pristionchus fissidentatus]
LAPDAAAALRLDSPQVARDAAQTVVDALHHESILRPECIIVLDAHLQSVLNVRAHNLHHRLVLGQHGQWQLTRNLEEVAEVLVLHSILDAVHAHRVRAVQIHRMLVRREDLQLLRAAQHLCPLDALSLGCHLAAVVASCSCSGCSEILAAAAPLPEACVGQPL